MTHVVPLPKDAELLFAVEGHSCGEAHDGFICTRRLSHEGPHIAHGNRDILAWVDCDPDLLTDEGL